ncbi:hypothetical protein GWI33_022042 [Rhynchophorus ferrugineus]|uniref:Uncharacterized protein n=1 Tax=Rhynchophorus ferrugineus TaxID=354439 RepID=A0A834ISW5_RHYFE|nr:hypothetical protein GWI33_022042 [Rhynchophorus ferrugineus]
METPVQCRRLNLCVFVIHHRLPKTKLYLLLITGVGELLMTGASDARFPPRSTAAATYSSRPRVPRHASVIAPTIASAPFRGLQPRDRVIFGAAAVAVPPRVH